jgi:hypothetical protein
VQDVARPPLAKTADVRQLVAKPGGDQQAPSGHPYAAAQLDLEAAFGLADPGHGVLDDLAAVALHFGLANGQQVAGHHPVAGKEPVHVRCGGIARLARVHHEHRASGTGQDQRR